MSQKVSEDSSSSSSSRSRSLGDGRVRAGQRRLTDSGLLEGMCGWRWRMGGAPTALPAAAAAAGAAGMKPRTVWPKWCKPAPRSNWCALCHEGACARGAAWWLITFVLMKRAGPSSVAHVVQACTGQGRARANLYFYVYFMLVPSAIIQQELGGWLLAGAAGKQQGVGFSLAWSNKCAAGLRHDVLRMLWW